MVLAGQIDKLAKEQALNDVSTVSHDVDLNRLISEQKLQDLVDS